MSLTKKDPKASGGLRVAANDPHLVSLGGGRLSTAVTIHYIPLGKITIGSLPSCNISLNGSGLRPLHCTVNRLSSGEVLIEPENNARVLIDGTKILTKSKLTQGAMITIGNSNYLRYNDPAEAELIKSTMGSNERISMPQIDFTQNSNDSYNKDNPDLLKKLNYDLEIENSKKTNEVFSLKNNLDLRSLNNFHSPKVFTADSITVNTPAKDVLGPKYANFAKNLIENHNVEKNYSSKNNDICLKVCNNTNTPSNFIQNTPVNYNADILAKVNNIGTTRNQLVFSSTYDRYPKPLSYGSLQLFSMNGVNSELNSNLNCFKSEDQQISPQEQEKLDEILKICTEYDKQNQSVQSSPIVQNRIKTNGSLPRENKSPLFDVNNRPPHHVGSLFTEKINTGYENVKNISESRIILPNSPTKSIGYENVIISGYVPQSPRTKIKTTCISPKKTSPVNNLIQSFESQLKMEIEMIQEKKNETINNSLENNSSLKRRQKRNINNLTINLNSNIQSTNENNVIDNLRREREIILSKIRSIKTHIADLQRQENEVLRELDMEKALVSAELTMIAKTLTDMEKNFKALQNRIYRLEAQRNASRVMQETQQAKLKQSIEMQQEEIVSLEKMIETTAINDDNLKEDLQKKQESLENDRKLFEDLEFQYLEEETDWLAYREELHSDLKFLAKHIDDKRLQILHLKGQCIQNQNSASSDTKMLENNVISLIKALDKSREKLQEIDKSIFNISGKKQDSESDEDHFEDDNNRNNSQQIISESFLGTTKILSNNTKDNDLMSRIQNQKLNEIDKSIFNISGKKQNSESDEDHFEDHSNRNNSPKIMSESFYSTTEIKSNNTKVNDLMSRSLNENMFFNNIEISFKKDKALQNSKPNNDIKNISEIKNNSPNSIEYIESNPEENKIVEITPELVRRENNEEKDPILKLKYNVKPNQTDLQKAVLNLTLANDDFEVNPLEKRIPSQDDIDRICKITSNAPISTQGASIKIIESIKEIERNRQLLLAQQGSYVIEHERQKMLELKQKSHNEAKTQYFSSHANSILESPKSDGSTESYESNNSKTSETRKSFPAKNFSTDNLEEQRTQEDIFTKPDSDILDDI